MASLAFLEGYHYVPRIDKELLEAHKEGLICLSGCASSEFSEFILKDQLDEAPAAGANGSHRSFGKDFYIEIQNNGLDIQKQCAEGAIDIANRLGLPLVATCDAHYLCQDDARPTTCCCASTPASCARTTNRMRYGSDQFYVRAPEEMYQLFPGPRGRGEAQPGDRRRLSTSSWISRSAISRSSRRRTGRRRRTTCANCARRACTSATATARRQAVRDRLEHELGIICRMGFASYFLIVWDFVRFAVENGIPASARGSACGAMVSYVLKLSHVDPLEYDLLFERFLDPNRSEAPDIDIDFCQDRREEVIAYVKQKYGEESVAQIAHLRHHGRQGGHQGRGPRPRHAAGPRQPADQHGPQDARHHARRRAEAEPRAAGRSTTPTRRSAN